MRTLRGGGDGDELVVAPGWAYIGAFAAALAVSLALTPTMRHFGVRIGALDRPGGHKSHATPVPYLGGLAIVLGFALPVVLLAAVGAPPGSMGELWPVLALGGALAAVGLVDDRYGLGVVVRIAAQVLAGAGLWSIGVRVGLTGVEVVDLAVTVLWVVAVTNAFNLLDNMDGLSAGIAVIAAAGFATIAGLNGQFLVASLALALAGSALGFLVHNRYPARIYMGDAGSLFLGFVLATIGIKLRFDRPIEVTFLIPVLVLGVAIFDLVLVVTTRLLNGRSPFAGGRDHVSHRLVHIGIPVPAAVSLIYGAAVALSWVALIASRVDIVTGVLLMALVVAVGMFVGVLLGAVRVYDADGGPARPKGRIGELQERTTGELVRGRVLHRAGERPDHGDGAR